MLPSAGRDRRGGLRTSQSAGWPGAGEDQDVYRFHLSFRETSRLIEHGYRRPLSVSTDLIGVVAMRCAYLLDRLAARGDPVHRSGSGRVIEAYPAPALVSWGLGGRLQEPGRRGSHPRAPQPAGGRARGHRDDPAAAPRRWARITTDSRAGGWSRAPRRSASPSRRSPRRSTGAPSGEGWIHVPRTAPPTCSKSRERPANRCGGTGRP